MRDITWYEEDICLKTVRFTLQDFITLWQRKISFSKQKLKKEGKLKRADSSYQGDVLSVSTDF